MKKKIIAFFIFIVLILCMTGCYNSEGSSLNSGSVISNQECCDGCMCGDSIELLKNTETAWSLATLNKDDEYEVDKESFINFHGNGKNKFAFFSNNGDVKGDFYINEDSEIILVSDDNKSDKITCKLGEEKDLIAVLICNNNFGTFILQKEGTLELPDIVKDTIFKTKTIKVKSNNKSKTIKDKKDIDAFVAVINDSKVWTGAVTLPSPKYEIRLIDDRKKVIAKIEYNPGHYFDIKINKKNYSLTNIDNEQLSTILE